MTTQSTDAQFQEFLAKYVTSYTHLEYVYWPEKGFIVWRLSTGENVELLHIKTFVRSSGYASELVREMVKRLIKKPPFFSIFGFALASRVYLKEVYTHLGFHVTDNIKAPYKDDSSFIFWRSYEELKEFYKQNPPA